METRGHRYGYTDPYPVGVSNACEGQNYQPQEVINPLPATQAWFLALRQNFAAGTWLVPDHLSLHHHLLIQLSFLCILNPPTLSLLETHRPPVGGFPRRKSLCFSTSSLLYFNFQNYWKVYPLQSSVKCQDRTQRTAFYHHLRRGWQSRRHSSRLHRHPHSEIVKLIAL